MIDKGVVGKGVVTEYLEILASISDVGVVGYGRHEQGMYEQDHNTLCNKHRLGREGIDGVDVFAREISLLRIKIQNDQEPSLLISGV